MADARIVVPYVNLHLRTALSVAAYAPAAELIALEPADGESYWRALATAWQDCASTGRDLVVIEQDLELRADVLPAFASCPRQWCTFAYPIYNELQHRWGTATQALGCVRFRAQLMQRDPDVWQRFTRTHWDRLDAELATILHRPPFTFTPCTHGPELTHWHQYQRGPGTIRGQSGG